MWFDTFATVRYSPKLLGQSSSRWWLVFDCDINIAKYYRKLYELQNYKCERLERASWDAHITVVRDEEPPYTHRHLWERYSGDSLWLRVFADAAATNGFYWWLPIWCPRAYNMREELGLPRQPECDFHITIGHGPEHERIQRITKDMDNCL